MSQHQPHTVKNDDTEKIVVLRCLLLFSSSSLFFCLGSGRREGFNHGAMERAVGPILMCLRSDSCPCVTDPARGIALLLPRYTLVSFTHKPQRQPVQHQDVSQTLYWYHLLSVQQPMRLGLCVCRFSRLEVPSPRQCSLSIEPGTPARCPAPRSTGSHWTVGLVTLRRNSNFRLFCQMSYIFKR